MVGPAAESLAPLEVKQKAALVRKAEDVLDKRVAELVSSFRCMERFRKYCDVSWQKCARVRVFRTAQARPHRDYQGSEVIGEESGRLLHCDAGLLLFLAGKDHVASVVTKALRAGFPVRGLSLQSETMPKLRS